MGYSELVSEYREIVGELERRAHAKNPVMFARSLGLEPDPWQASMLASQSARIVLNCSRQTGKSTTAAIRALHRSLYRPGSLVLLLSPSLRQSSELFRKVVDFLKRLPHVPELLEENRLSLTLENKSRIVSLPGSDGTIRGFSAVSEIIVDEAAFVPDELYRSVRPMLAVSRGALVLMSTPNGKRGFFYEAWQQDGWERYQVKATDCARIDQADLERDRIALGPWFAQEYLCEFIDADKSVFESRFVEAAFTDEFEAVSWPG